MKRFMLLYGGPTTPPDATHEGWPEWFDQLGDKLVDRGAPLTDGAVVHGDGSTGSETRLNGYSIIQAEDIDHVRSLVENHPFLMHGLEYSIEVYSLP